MDIKTNTVVARKKIDEYKKQAEREIEEVCEE